MSAASKPDVTDSPWFWVLVFSLMALLALFVVSGKYGRRQANIERQYQARERVAEDLAAANNPVGDSRIDDEAPRRQFATPDNKLIPLWPLATILILVAIAAAVMLRRDSLRSSTISPANPSP